MTSDKTIITVLLFGILRDRAGVAKSTLEFQRGLTVADACLKLNERFPAITPHLSRIAFAVNQQYVPSTTELHDGDELALIPPVSGG